MHKVNEYFFSLLFFIFSSVACISVQAPSKTEPITTHEEASIGKNNSKNLNRKDLLDVIRRGIVIIKVKAYAGAEQGCDFNKVWSGTGFIVDLHHGLIATNHHVAGKLAVCTYEVKFSDGTIAIAKLRYFDPLLDFAFLTMDPKKFPKSVKALEFASEPIKVNDTVYSMGNSGGDEFSTYKGTVFSIYENLGPFPHQSFKFSGLTVAGASGSPLISENGKVVGIIYGGKFISGIALPVSYIARAVESLSKNEIPSRRSIGIIPHYQDLNNAVEAKILPKEERVAYFKEFSESDNKILSIDTTLVNSPANEHFKSGDIIWKINGKLIGPELAKLDEIFDTSENKKIPIEVYREGAKVSFEITSYPLINHDEEKYIVFAGTTFYKHNEQLRSAIGDKGPGVYISNPEITSPFNELYKDEIRDRLRSRPLKITHINNQPIETLEHLEELIPSLLKTNVFYVRYIDFLGQQYYDYTVSADRQERFAVLSYDAKFDTPKVLEFDSKIFEWNIKDIKSKS